jgi:hypothetical protein
MSNYKFEFNKENNKNQERERIFQRRPDLKERFMKNQIKTQNEINFFGKKLPSFYDIKSNIESEFNKFINNLGGINNLNRFIPENLKIDKDMLNKEVNNMAEKYETVYKDQKYNRFKGKPREYLRQIIIESDIPQYILFKIGDDDDDIVEEMEKLSIDEKHNLYQLFANMTLSNKVDSINDIAKMIKNYVKIKERPKRGRFEGGKRKKRTNKKTKTKKRTNRKTKTKKKRTNRKTKRRMRLKSQF